ncbi:hypothetical protein DITRI_Ditri09bG0050900 [Diplodiscus trichospermus]
MSAFSETVIEVWDGWEIRALLLLSLSLQVILLAFGSQRKYSGSIWIRFFVWSAYMSADAVAIFALGILARNLATDSGEGKSNKNFPLQLFWTPFLILHLGGPDTITAYALEDNELWPRHFLALLVQTGIAFYVFLKSWGDTHLKLIAIPVFIAGIIKYGERTWVLRNSSTKNIRNCLLSGDYAEVAEEKINFSRRKVSPPIDSRCRDYSLCQAYYLFNRLRYLFADLTLGSHERNFCHSLISEKSSEAAFELVEGQLGLLYDLLYTKATIVYSKFGIFLRCSTFFCSVFAMIAFAVFIDRHPYSTVDITITCLLLGGVVLLEVCALALVMFSDWTKLWLPYYLKPMRIGKRWSRTIFKYNLVKFCLVKQDTIGSRFQKLLGIKEIVEKHLNVDCDDVDAELQNLIFHQLKERSENITSISNVNECKKLLSYRGDHVLDKMKCPERLKYGSTIEVEFDQSLLLWHIATQLCYWDDVRRLNNNLEGLNKCSNVSKCLSEYMLYLLVMYPNMLPKGIGEIRYHETCFDATSFFQLRRERIGTDVDKACYELYENGLVSLKEPQEDETGSALFHGCRLAKQLQSLESEEDWGCEKKWEMINKVWVEMLAYAAVNCGWKGHVQQLRRGGELLTHVSLLMANLGLSEQYRLQGLLFHQFLP